MEEDANLEVGKANQGQTTEGLTTVVHFPVALVTDPDWLGSPQHFGVALAWAFAVAFVAAWRWNCTWWIAAGLGLGAAASAELVYELAEYSLRYKDEVHATAYQDTLADLANSLFGGLLGGAIGAWLSTRVVGR